MIVMTSTFDVLSEGPLHPSDFGEGPIDPLISLSVLTCRR